MMVLCVGRYTTAEVVAVAVVGRVVPPAKDDYEGGTKDETREEERRGRGWVKEGRKGVGIRV